MSAARALKHCAVSSHFQCIWLPICTAKHWLSHSVMLRLPAVYCCRYAMQRDTQRLLLETGREYAAHLHLKPYTPNQLFYRHIPKIQFSRCYNKLSVGYFGLKLQRHIPGKPEANITSCRKGHNRCPLNYFNIKGYFQVFAWQYSCILFAKKLFSIFVGNLLFTIKLKCDFFYKMSSFHAMCSLQLFEVFNK